MTRDTFDLFEDRARGRFGDNEAASGRADQSGDIELTMTLRQNKPLSIAVTHPNDVDGDWIWLAKSQIQFAPKGNGLMWVSVPHWLAKEKGLL